MYHNIIHISDIHIRSGDSNKSRYDEYITVFNNLFDSLSQQEAIIQKTAVIVITGDIFHDKNKIGPSGIKIAVNLLQQVASLAPVFLIRGNHDYRQDFPNEHDMISALMSYDIPNVTYLDETGIHNFSNLSFGLTTVQETLLFGSTSGISSELPPFPIPSSSDNYKIALFHGTISGSLLQNGSTSTPHGYPIDWFQGYDAILLGDIHLQQIKRATLTDNISCNIPNTTICSSYSYSKEQIPWGYSGSLIQQDFGEPIKGHGYIIWNLKNKLINIYHVKNKYGMIKLHYTGNINNIIVENKQYIKPITTHANLDIIKTSWFPDMLNIRVIGDNISSETLDKISDKIKSYGKQILSITKKNISKLTPTNNESVVNKDNDINNINSLDSLIQFIDNKLQKDRKVLTSNKWREWLKNPNTLMYNKSTIPEQIRSKLNRKTDNLNKSIIDFTNEFDKIQSQQQITGTLTLNKLEWSWLLNYKSGNSFDFNKNNGCISVINAKNGNGKSNFLEIICIAIFGEGFPSRHNSNYSSNIICNKKPSGVMASTQITFTLNKDLYIIKRALRNAATKRKIDFETVILYKVNSNSKDIIHQGNNAVSAWISSNIGEVSSYLMSTMLTQNADSDFFSLEHLKQKELLDTILSLTHINSLKTLLKDASAYYKLCIDLFESYLDGYRSKQVDPRYVNELSVCKTELEQLLPHRDELFNQWCTVSHSELSKYNSFDDLTHEYNKILDNLQLLSYISSNNSKEDIGGKLVFYENELAQYHSFVDLDSELDSQINLNEYTEQFESGELRKNISELYSSLQQHPFYKDSQYDVYEKYDVILSKCFQKSDKTFDRNKIFDQNKIFDSKTSEIEEVGPSILFDSNVSIKNFVSINSNLIKTIYEFQTWNQIYTQKFESNKKYFEDSSQITTLQNSINQIIQYISDAPTNISKLSKQYDKLKKNYKILLNNKNVLMDTKPNKPSVDNNWLQTTENNILDKYTLESLTNTKNFLLNSIENIPVLLNRLNECSQKVIEYKKYISDCSNYPFNPKCSACKKQPWRTMYNKYIEELPILEKTILELNEELDKLKYNNSLELSALKNDLTEVNEIISTINKYNLEKIIFTEWYKWLQDYEKCCNKYDKTEKEMNEIEHTKKQLETEYETKRNDKIKLQTQLDSIQTIQQEYDLYISEKTQKEELYNDALSILEYNWFHTLKQYRLNIHSYIMLINKKRGELLEIKDIWSTKSKLTELRDNLALIYKAYPSWTEWKDLDKHCSDLTIKIKELEFTIDNGLTSVNSEHITFVNALKTDYEDINYISEAFEGFQEWLYTDLIAPIIKRRVNCILEMMCDERPLLLECEWLDIRQGMLSWFINDSGSSIIIQKASGFQRFIIGIAMRVAINQIGLNKMRFTEFFIDEGFTTCDVDNLEKVPTFLKGLLGHYTSIYLATHLEDLKLCADKHIFIERNDDGLSLINYGGEGGNDNDDRDCDANIDYTKPKKKGRPTKYNILKSDK